jgi:hypothetical protein
VIAGIVFLAFELQQNNELMEAEARANQLDARLAHTAKLIEGVDLSSIGFKVDRGEELTPKEQYQMRLFAIYMYIQWEWQHREYVAGTLGEEDLPVAGWRNIVRDNNEEVESLYLAAWRTYSSSGARSDAYVQFMNDHVFGE